MKEIYKQDFKQKLEFMRIWDFGQCAHTRGM